MTFKKSYKPCPNAKPRYLQFLIKYLHIPNTNPIPNVNATCNNEPLIRCHQPNKKAAINTPIHLNLGKKLINVS